MSDRLSLPLHPTIRDPRTGMRMRAIGFLKTGKPVFPIMGASEGAPEVTDQNAGGAGETRGTEGNASGSSGGATDDGRDPQRKIKALEEEKDRHYTARTKAEQERDEVARRLKEYEDKDKSELERTQGKVEELTNENAALKAQLERLQIDNSFFVENSVQWHDPADAKEFVLRELGEVKVDDKGRVVGLKEAIEKVAKAKPYLVKPETGGERPPASGQPPRKQGGNASDDEMRRRYPALRNR